MNDARPDDKHEKTIRPARPAEAEAISALVLEVFDAFVAPHYGAEGRASFVREAAPEDIANCVAEGRLGFLAADPGEGGRLVGYIEAQDNHIRKLFVAGPYQRRGIARCLLQQVMARRKGAEITVNAAPGSMDAYTCLGFQPAGPWVTLNGITFRPMVRRAPA